MVVTYCSCVFFTITIYCSLKPIDLKKETVLENLIKVSLNAYFLVKRIEDITRFFQGTYW